MARRAIALSLCLAPGLALACTGLSGLSGGDGSDGGSIDAATGAADARGMDGGKPSIADAATCAADLTKDAKNCGRCGRDCLGAACTAGMCESITLASHQASPNAMVLSGGQLFFTTEDDGRVQSIPTTGGAITGYVAGEDHPRGVAVAGTTLYWANGDLAYDDAGATRGGIWRCELPACATRAIVASIDQAMEPVVHNGFLFFGSGYEGQLYRTSLVTGDSILIASGASTNLAIDDAYAYHSGAGALLRVPAMSDGSGADQVILSGASGSGFIALDDTRIFWTFDDDSRGGHVISFSKASPAAGSIEYGSKKDNLAPVGVALDDVNVYWATAGTDNGTQRTPSGDGKVLYCPKLGCGPRGPGLLATGNVEAGPLVIDDRALYWTEIGSANGLNGRIRKVAKP